MTTTDQHFKIHPVDTVRSPQYECIDAPGRSKLYMVKGGSEPVLHLELIFKAGRGHEQNRAAAQATAALLSEGTVRNSSKQITEQLEYYGATLRTSASADVLSVGVYCMSKVFVPVLAILSEMLSEADFPEHELDIYKRNRAQKITIALQQNETLANRMLSTSLFGDHPYGDPTTVEDVLQVQRKHLLEHSALLGTSNMLVFFSGKIEDQHLTELLTMLGNLKSGKPSGKLSEPGVPSAERVAITGPQKFQSSLRIGRQMMPRSHEHFTHVFVLNAVLGGFFGSRLMKNIREDKGLTYSIYSSLETLMRAACLIISTEADRANTERVEREVMHEIHRLQDELVTDRELVMVKNYLMGNLMMQLDGPFRKINAIKTIALESLDEGYFDRFVTGIRTITSQQIREMAVKYLQPSDLHVCLVR